MSELIHVKLPDGSVKEVPFGTTALDIAKGISPRLADAALAAQIKPSTNGAEPKLVDLTKPLEEDVELRLLTERDPEASKFSATRRRTSWLLPSSNFFPRP